jgi:4'-phosphopantetheinyl transferase EntD
MIEEILPTCVSAVEALDDSVDGRLFAEEELAVGRAVDKRMREFMTARICARAALAKLGFPAAPILTGEHGEPLWPTGVVGSITHCDGYRACAVARSSEILTVGIDAEPNAALPDRLIGDIARPEELPGLRRLELQSPEVRWDRLLFSAKESVYKAWFPLARRWLGFEDAVIVFDPGAGTFTARLLVSGPPMADGPLLGFSGKWMVRDGIVVTAIAVSVC